jgi:hypothetical protein
VFDGTVDGVGGFVAFVGFTVRLLSERMRRPTAADRVLDSGFPTEADDIEA